MAASPSDGGLPAFVAARPCIFGIAYRILGSAAEAEDVVQDVWVRWQTTDRSVVRNAKAFLATAATRLAINVAESARSRRVEYVGPWLPEPVDTAADPGLGAERGEALELAVLMLLEKLSPRERAAYVLREAFDYPYQEIAEILGLNEPNVRQLVTRARQHIAHGQRAPVTPTEQERLLTAFIGAAQHGDRVALENLFAEDIVSYSDGGGLVRAARSPVVGRERVARFIAAIASHFWAGVTLSRIEANGRTSILLSRGDAVVGLVSVGASAAGIDQVLWLLRPSKLAALSARPAQGDPERGG